MGAGENLRVLSPGRLVATTLLAAVVALVICLAICQTAHAHATLTGTVPADGAVLQAPPDAVILSFNEAATPIVASLVLPGGNISELQQFSTSGATISIALPDDLANGSYALSWRAVSEDGHPISGTTFFVVGAPSQGAAPEIGASQTGVAESLWIARLLLFIGLFFGVGGAVFRLLADEIPSKAASASHWTMLAGFAAAPAILCLQGLDLSGAGLSAALDARTWSLGLNSPYGATVLLAVFSLVCGLAALHVRKNWQASLAGGLALLGIGFSISASGHASAADPQWVTRSALFVHVTTIAWWVGALFPLVLLLRQDRRTAAPPLIRFSRAIPFAIVPLVASGVILAIVQLGPPGPAWWSAYGQILAAKLSLLVVLFGIASWNRWVLTAPAATGEVRALQHMRRGIFAEIVIILAVLGLVSAWRFTPPPRALAVDAPSATEIMLTDGTLHAMLTLLPARVGSVDVAISIRTGEGELVTPKSVKLSLEPGAGQIAPLTQMAEPLEDGNWHIEDITIPLAGSWLTQLEVRVSDFQLIKLNGEIDIAP